MRKTLFYFLLVTGLTSWMGCAKSPTSPQNGTWKSATLNAPFSGRYGLASVVFNNEMWILGGYGSTNTGYQSDVWYTSNGVNWTQSIANAPFGGRYGFGAVTLSGNIFVIGGNLKGILQNDVWSSPDGVTWTQVNAGAPFAARSDFSTLIYNNLMWVIGGWDGKSARNDVWSSPDGVTWTQATANAAFGIRWGHTSAAFNGKMFVMGGALNGPVPNQTYNDVWSSTDGITWTQATSNAAWAFRYYHMSVVLGGSLYVMGGFFNNGISEKVLNDVWTSPDGANWTLQGYGSTSFPARFYGTSLTFNNSIWIIAGGYNIGTVTYLNDVWHSP